jgi:ribonuclease HI
MIKVYTDGSCSPNPGAGGYGIVTIIGDQITRRYGYSQKITTNNLMEMEALYRALRMLPDRTHATIYTDSKYVCNCYNWLWGRKKNLELWKKIDLESARVWFARVEWVKGHKGDEFNEMADRLANKGMMKARTIPEIAQVINLQRRLF